MTNKEFESLVIEKLTTIEWDVSWLKTDVSWLKQDVSWLKQDVSWLKQDVSWLKQDVSRLDKKFDRLDNKVDSGFIELESAILNNTKYTMQAFEKIAEMQSQKWTY